MSDAFEILKSIEDQTDVDVFIRKYLYCMRHTVHRRS